MFDGMVNFVCDTLRNMLDMIHDNDGSLEKGRDSALAPMQREH